MERGGRGGRGVKGGRGEGEGEEREVGWEGREGIYEAGYIVAENLIWQIGG